MSDNPILPFPNAVDVGIQKDSEMTTAEELYAKAMDDLAAAEVEQAETFLSYKFGSAEKVTDRVAEAQAEVEMAGKITRLTAVTEIARTRMYNQAGDDD